MAFSLAPIIAIPGVVYAVDSIQQAASADAITPAWSNVVSPATLIAILVNGVTVALFLRKQGAKEALTDKALADNQTGMKSMRDDFEAAKLERDRWREAWADRYQTGREEFRRGVDQQLAGVQAAIVLMREQHSEFKTDIARTYVTKSELYEVEARNAAAFERVNDRLDHLAQQLQEASTKIMGAVERLHAIQMTAPQGR